MKISELIEKLEAVSVGHGDLEVARANFDLDYGSTTEPVECVEVFAVVRTGGYRFDVPERGRIAELKVVEIQ